MPKSLLRMALLERRRALSEAERSAAGERIQAVFLSLPEYQSAGTVSVYWPINGEVATERVVLQAIAVGKMVCLPAVCGDTLRFREISSLQDLVSGRFGILEPGPGCREVSPDQIDQFVVPGVGFDLSGQRVGYGKGFYDKVLHVLERQGRFTAFCYECQLVESITGEAHDVLMDRIITEQRVIAPVLRK